MSPLVIGIILSVVMIIIIITTVILNTGQKQIEQDPTKKIDCKMSDWSQWSSCDSSFKRTRTRTIIIQPKNGGEPCGVDKEVDDTFCVPDIMYNIDQNLIDQSGTGDINVPIILYSDIGYQGIAKPIRWTTNDGIKFLQLNYGLDFDLDTYLWKSMKVNPGVEIQIYSSERGGLTNKLNLIIEHNIPNIKYWFLNLPKNILLNTLQVGNPWEKVTWMGRYGPLKRDDLLLGYFIKPISLKRKYNKTVPILTLYPEKNYQGVAYPLYSEDEMALFSQSKDNSEKWYWKSLNIPSNSSVNLRFSSDSGGLTDATNFIIDRPIPDLQEWINGPDFGKVNRDKIFYPFWSHQDRTFKIKAPFKEVEQLTNTEVPGSSIPYSNYIRYNNPYRIMISRLNLQP